MPLNQISWHGGEPLLRGIEFFEKAVELQSILRANGVSVKNSIQTNSVLLNKQWVKFFKKNSFSIGVSLDGPEDINDHHRVFTKNQGSFKEVSHSLDLLKSEGVKFHIISVIGQEHLDKAKYYWDFISTRDIQSFDIHPSYGFDGKQSKTNISPKQFSEFAVELFKLWFDNGVKKVRVKLFDDFLKGLYSGSTSTCYQNGGCTSILALNANGDIIPCTRPFDLDSFNFGNINNSKLIDIINGERWENFHKLNQIGMERSKACNWNFLCNGGCPQHRNMNNKQDVSGNNYFCGCQTTPKTDGLNTMWDGMYSYLNKRLCTPDLYEVKHPSLINYRFIS